MEGGVGCHVLASSLAPSSIHCLRASGDWMTSIILARVSSFPFVLQVMRLGMGDCANRSVLPVCMWLMALMANEVQYSMRLSEGEMVRFWSCHSLSHTTPRM